MKNSPEVPKKYTPKEMAEIEKSRTLSDAELLKEGAEYKVGEKGEKELELTGEQMGAQEMLDEKKEKEVKDIVHKMIYEKGAVPVTKMLGCENEINGRVQDRFDKRNKISPPFEGQADLRWISYMVEETEKKAMQIAREKGPSFVINAMKKLEAAESKITISRKDTPEFFGN